MKRVDLLRFAGAGAAAGAALALAPGCTRESAASASGNVFDFYGAHQAGIVTPQQERLHFAAFDVATDDRREIIALLQNWTRAAARLTRGKTVGDDNVDPQAPPEDTGEADGLPASGLTITVGFGPSFFERDGRDRLGVRARGPQFRVLPPFSGDELVASSSNGDICVQACADDPQVAFHAIRNFGRIAAGTADLRWAQLGFGRTASTSAAQTTPRNLMGFKDGTNNLKLENPQLLNEHIWINDGPEHLHGGTYLVTRRIRMTIEAWDRANLADQEATIGRHKASGAPLGAHDEFAPVQLAAQINGAPAIPPRAHIRLAGPAENGGTRLLRRGYSFTDGIDPRTGHHDAGLFFMSFQNDPQKYIDVQRRLAENDALNEYIAHTASGIFFVPRGVAPGGYFGAELFA